jgi:hypothetical protein
VTVSEVCPRCGSSVDADATGTHTPPTGRSERVATTDRPTEFVAKLMRVAQVGEPIA